jgi:hypothetical protein
MYNDLAGENDDMKFLPLPIFMILTMLMTSTPALAENMSDWTVHREAPLNKDVKEIPQKEVEGNLLVKQHCTKCHSESRIMNALQSMHSSRDKEYEKEVKNIISRKIRLTNGDISRQDGKRLIEYLLAVWQNQKTGGKTAS